VSKIEFSQSISLKVVIYDHVRADNTSTLYLRVTIERKKRDINLKIYWPKEYFDKDRQVALPRHPKDQDMKPLNMVIEEAKGRANRIKLRYFTDGKRLTLDGFTKEFDTFESRDNFLFFWKNRMEADFNDGVISSTTFPGHKNSLNRLTEFTGSTGVLNMDDINSDFVSRYQSWLSKKKKLKYNSVLKSIKIMQTYFTKARANGFKVAIDAFDKAPKSYRAGERAVLELEEFSALMDLYYKRTLPEVGQEVLRKFLFSCYTGLRISDSAHVSRSMIHNGKLTIKLKKGERYGKEVTIPLEKEALELVEGRKGLLFVPVADPLCNRWLKSIAEIVGIEKRLTFHVSRDTYASFFIASGGDVGTLKEFMGHSNINTTQIYMKMSEKRGVTQMAKMGAMLRKKKPE
jgi:integrase/recombinase XerD